MKFLSKIFGNKAADLNDRAEATEAFFRALHDGDVEKVLSVVDIYPGAVWWQDKKTRQPMLIAVERGDLEMFKQLVARGGNVEAALVSTHSEHIRFSSPKKAIHIAIERKDTAFLDYLIGMGVDLQTPMAYATSENGFSSGYSVKSFSFTPMELAQKLNSHVHINMLRDALTGKQKKPPAPIH